MLSWTGRSSSGNRNKGIERKRRMIDLKKYVKPDLFYENFELSHSVANCSPALNHTENECTLDSWEAPDLYLDAGENVFHSQCTITSERLEGYCYWSGSDETRNIFTS